MHCSVVKNGSPELLPCWISESLCVALESYISINQVNVNCGVLGRVVLPLMLVNSVAACPPDVKSPKLDWIGFWCDNIQELFDNNHDHRK